MFACSCQSGARTSQSAPEDPPPKPQPQRRAAFKFVGGAAPIDAICELFVVIFVICPVYLQPLNHERDLRAPFLVLVAAGAARTLHRCRKTRLPESARPRVERRLGSACGHLVPLGLVFSVAFWSGFFRAAAARLRQATCRRTTKWR